MHCSKLSSLQTKPTIMQHLHNWFLLDPQQHLPKISRQLPSRQHKRYLCHLPLWLYSKLQQHLHKKHIILPPTQPRRYLHHLRPRILLNFKQSLPQTTIKLPQRQLLRAMSPVYRSLFVVKLWSML